MKIIPALVFASAILLLASCASSGGSREPSPAAAPGATDGKIYNLGELDRPPSVRGRRSPPDYPFELKKNGIQGETLVRFVVDTQGKVRDIEIVWADHPGFGKAAADAVAKWKFNPGKKGGVLVNTRMQLPIGFHLNR